MEQDAKKQFSKLEKDIKDYILQNHWISMSHSKFSNLNSDTINKIMDNLQQELQLWHVNSLYIHLEKYKDQVYKFIIDKGNVDENDILEFLRELLNGTF